MDDAVRELLGCKRLSQRTAIATDSYVKLEASKDYEIHSADFESE